MSKRTNKLIALTYSRNFTLFLLLLIVTYSYPFNFSISLVDKISLLDIDNNLYTINGVEKDDNRYYLMNGRVGKVVVVDSSFTKVGSFGKIGNGPGEFYRGLNSFTIVDSIIYCYDGSKQEILKFNKQLYYIDNKTIGLCNSNEILINFGSSLEFIYGYLQTWDFKNLLVKSKLKILGKDGSTIIFRDSTKLVNNNGVFDPDKSLNIIVSGNQNILCVGEFNSKRYQFKIYDNSLNEIVVNRKFSSIPFMGEEIEINRKYGYQYLKTKPAYHEIYVGKDRYIFVNVSTFRDERDKNTFYLDIFDNDRYLGRTSLDFIDNSGTRGYNNRLWFIEDKILFYNEDDEILNIYKYSIGE